MKPCCKAGVKTYCHLPALTSVHRSAPHQRPLSARYSCNSPPATFGACHASLQDKTIKECSVLYSTLLQCITFQINSGDIGLNHVISFENFLTNDQTATVQCRYATTIYLTARFLSCCKCNQDKIHLWVRGETHSLDFSYNSSSNWFILMLSF